MKNHYDIAVIGGGAGGLFFTALAAKMHKDKNIILIEKNQRVGKKLLITGNGRCNLTNIYVKEENYHGTFRAYTGEVLKACSSDKVLELFSEMGLMTKADDFGRVYPKSNQASSVLDVLRFNAEKENVTFCCECKALSVEKSNLFKIATDKGNFTADKVIVATGGAASPKAGGDKSGYEILKNLGHTVIKPSPALCPVLVKSDYLKSLKGVRVQGEIGLEVDGKCVRKELGEIQFTENALSGICVFNLSGYIEKHKSCILKIKLMPELDFNALVETLCRNREVFSTLDAENLMTGMLHKRVAQIVLKDAKVSLNKKARDISDKEIKAIASKLNSLDFEVLGVKDLSDAQVTKGGVKGDEIDAKTMESKKIKGLYVIGEALDCNGDCGGFNLHFAFATAYLAASAL